LAEVGSTARSREPHHSALARECPRSWAYPGPMTTMRRPRPGCAVRCRAADELVATFPARSCPRHQGGPMKRTLILAAMTLVFPLGAASADTPAASRPLATKGDEDSARARKAGRICELIIEGDEVGGERITPNGEQLTG